MNIPWPDEIIVRRAKSLIYEVSISIAIMLISFITLGGYSFIVLFMGLVFLVIDFSQFVNTMKSNAFLLKDNNFILNPVHRFHIRSKKIPVSEVEEVIFLSKSKRYGIFFENGKLILNLGGLSQKAVEKLHKSLNSHNIVVKNRIT